MRKPPKVSRGCGGVARAAVPPGSQIFEDLFANIQISRVRCGPVLGSLLVPAWFPLGAPFGTHFGAPRSRFWAIFGSGDVVSRQSWRSMGVQREILCMNSSSRSNFQT